MVLKMTCTKRRWYLEGHHVQFDQGIKSSHTRNTVAGHPASGHSEWNASTSAIIFRDYKSDTKSEFRWVAKHAVQKCTDYGCKDSWVYRHDHTGERENNLMELQAA